MARTRPLILIRPDVRFGSKADICSATGHVRFAPNSDRESGFPQTVMSALPLKANMCVHVEMSAMGPLAKSGHCSTHDE